MRNNLTKLYNYHEYPKDGSHRFTGSWCDVTIFNYQPGSLPPAGGTVMAARIPVVYASPKGSTAEIAQAVGKELQSAGYDTDVIAIKSVTSLESYKAVASGVRSLWVKSWEMLESLLENSRISCQKSRSPDLALVWPGKKSPFINNAIKKLQKTPDPVKPVAVTVFAGKPDPEKFSIFPEMYGGKGKGPETGDFRDREAIASWSIGLPKKLGV